MRWMLETVTEVPIWSERLEWYSNLEERLRDM